MDARTQYEQARQKMVLLELQLLGLRRNQHNLPWTIILMI